MTGYRIIRGGTMRLAILALCLAPAGVAAEVAKADAAPEHVVCRASVPTGSLMRRQMECMRAQAWNQTPDTRRADDLYTREAPLIFRAPSDPGMIVTGTAPFDTLPRLRMHGRLPYAQLVATVSDLLGKGACAIPGQTARQFDIDTPFAVKMAGPDLKQVLVRDTGCPELNSVVALAVLARADRGDLEAGDTASERWFGSRMRLTLR